MDVGWTSTSGLLHIGAHGMGHCQSAMGESMVDWIDGGFGCW